MANLDNDSASGTEEVTEEMAEEKVEEVTEETADAAAEEQAEVESEQPQENHDAEPGPSAKDVDVGDFMGEEEDDISQEELENLPLFDDMDDEFDQEEGIGDEALDPSRAGREGGKRARPKKSGKSKLPVGGLKTGGTELWNRVLEFLQEKKILIL
ncbi:MAG: hypothetical protein ACYTG7_14975, partial [Planctomycetota bacterium]